MEDEFDEIKIGTKPHKKYVTACLWAKNNNKSIKLLGRGSNITKTIDISEIIKRHYDIDVPNIDDILILLKEKKFNEATKKLEQYCKFKINVKSEKFNDKNISVVEIIIKN